MQAWARPHQNAMWNTSDSVLQSLGMIVTPLPKLIAVVGAGGKTSLIFRLAEELRSRGRRVVITTTTHMEVLYDDGNQPLVQTDSVDELISVIQQYGWAVAGKNIIEQHGKLSCHRLIYWGDNWCARALEAADVLLVEADGSACLPAKYPDLTKEPVLPPETDCVLALMSVRAVGQSFMAACQRSGLYAKRSGRPLTENARISAAQLSKMLCWGYIEGLNQRAYSGRVIPSLTHIESSSDMCIAQSVLTRITGPALLFDMHDCRAEVSHNFLP